MANFTRDYNAIQTAAKLKPIGCFHDMRKSFGTRCATAGMPLHELRDFMGHANITTTMEFYTTVVEGSARARLLRVTAA